jgi:SAM-dependent methyltransferase
MVTDWVQAENTNTRILLDGGTGIYGAMNEGIRGALGEHICFWNSGDTNVSHDELQTFVKYLKVESPAWVISQGVFDWGNFKNQNSETLDRFLKHESEGFISHQTVFVRKVFLEGLGNFDISYKVAADSKLIIQLAQKHNPTFYSERLVMVEIPNFAATNHRTARFEQIRITVECFRGRAFMNRLINILVAEIHTKHHKYWRTINKLLRRSELGSRVILPANYQMAMKIGSTSFGRALVLSFFGENIISLGIEKKLIRLAIVGGYESEPEVLLLRQLGFNLEITYFGIESGLTHLDLNNQNTLDSKHVSRFDLVICSQVWEHIWNHHAGMEILSSLLDNGGYLWLACPASNRAHGSPEYFSAGFSSEYLSNHVKSAGLKEVNSGRIGTTRLYKATHSMPTWLSVRAHKCPIFFSFDDRNLPRRVALRIRFLAKNIELTFSSGKPTSDQRWATESWVLARSVS